jgi:hypothetical protein
MFWGDIDVALYLFFPIRLMNGVFFLFFFPFYVQFAGFSRECLTEWNIFLNLAVPGMAMLSLEWWCFEIFVFICGMLVFAKYMQ